MMLFLFVLLFSITTISSQKNQLKVISSNRFNFIVTREGESTVPICNDPNEEFTKDALGSMCDVRCSTYEVKNLQICTDYFYQRCTCKDGYIREYVDGKCILPIECEETNIQTDNTRKIGKRRRNCTSEYNKFLDESLVKISSYLIKIGLDPMVVPDMSMKLPTLPGSSGGIMDLFNITLKNVSTVKRSKDSLICLSKNRLRVEISLGWDALMFNAEYRFLYYDERAGSFKGTAKGIEFLLAFVIDSRGRFKLLDAQLMNPGEFDILLGGDLSSLVENKIVKRIIAYLKNFIILTIQSDLQSQLQEQVEEINKMVKSN